MIHSIISYSFPYPVNHLLPLLLLHPPTSISNPPSCFFTQVYCPKVMRLVVWLVVWPPATWVLLNRAGVEVRSVRQSIGFFPFYLIASSSSSSSKSSTSCQRPWFQCCIRESLEVRRPFPSLFDSLPELTGRLGASSGSSSSSPKG